jgi:hypothetical protein
LTRLILVLSVLLSAAPALAQTDDWTTQDRREQARQRRQEAREEARERREERRRERQERWNERRERWEEWRRQGRDGVHLRMLRDYHLGADATAAEPIVILGGNATIDGHADDDVVVIGGRLRIGPKAVIGGDVVTVGGKADIDPAATIRGEIDETVVNVPDFDFDLGWPAWSWGGWSGGNRWGGGLGNWWPFAALSATVFRLGLIFVISLLLTVVAPNWIRSMGIRASSVFSSGLLGAAVEVLFVPALLAVVIGLVISIVGIPLLGAVPFVLAAGALAWTGGFAAVAVTLGARLRGTSVAISSSLVADLLVGFIAIAGLTLVAHFISLGGGWLTPFGWMTRAGGMAVEYVAWTIGLGAAISSLFVRAPMMPPPVPATSVSS